MTANPFLACARTHRLTGPGVDARCVFGKGGVRAAADKREGDGASPIGVWRFREVFYRADRLNTPNTALPMRAIRADMGWCDASDDPHYNQLITKPFAPSHEDMMREDGLYDLVVPLGYNDDPAVPGLGSAIFLHCWRTPTTPTRGCVAIERDALLALVALIKPGDNLEIQP